MIVYECVFTSTVGGRSLCSPILYHILLKMQVSAAISVSLMKSMS